MGVELDILWIPLKSSKQSPPSSPSRTSSTSTLSSSTTSRRSSTSSSTSGLPIKTKCVVSVFIYSANNLGHYTSSGGAAVPIPVGYLPSAQATVKVGAFNKKSKIDEESQQAEFKEGFFFQLGDSWKQEKLTISIADSKKSVSGFGSHEWRISDLVTSGVKRKIIPLDSKVPEQTMTVSIELLFPDQ